MITSCGITSRWIQTSGKPVLFLLAIFLPALTLAAQTPSPALLVLEKADNMLAIVDPAALKIVGRVPAGPDPHEIEASPDGKLAYISNYGGADSSLHTISVVDLVAQKALSPIDLGALRSPHGLAFAGGKLFFTAETNKVVGRYDPAKQAIEWLMGTGQDRTHMVLVSPKLNIAFTSNVSSGTISIIEQVDAPNPGFAPPPGAPPGSAPPPGPRPGGPHKTWHITNVPAGRGSEGFDLSPDGKSIWVANAQDGTVTIIDVAAKKALETFPVSVHGNRLKFTLDGQHVLVSGPGSSKANLVILDVAAHKEIKTFDLGGFSAGILMVPDGSKAYVAATAKDRVVAVDLKKLEIAGELPTGKGPDGLAWAQRQ
jgi:YVTN family beta-propeller protein